MHARQVTGGILAMEATKLVVKFVHDWPRMQYLMRVLALLADSQAQAAAILGLSGNVPFTDDDLDTFQDEYGKEVIDAVRVLQRQIEVSGTSRVPESETTRDDRIRSSGNELALAVWIAMLTDRYLIFMEETLNEGSGITDKLYHVKMEICAEVRDTLGKLGLKTRESQCHSGYWSFRWQLGWAELQKRIITDPRNIP